MCYRYEMRAVNNTMRHHQMQKHYKHITGCSEHECSPNISDLIERIANLEKNKGGTCDCSEQLSTIVSNITLINDYISNINNNITNILTRIDNIPAPTVRISPLTATGLDNLDTTYTKLLGNIENASEDELNDYYNDVISAIVGSNSLTAPIDLVEIEKAVLCTSIYDTNKDDIIDDVSWNDLEPEDKRTYIKQFILASPSNQTRAAYVTNEMLRSFAVVTDEQSEPMSVKLRDVRDDDPTMITPENQSVRLRGCPYLML